MRVEIMRKINLIPKSNIISLILRSWSLFVLLMFFLASLEPIYAQTISCTEYLCDPHNALCGLICQVVPQLPAFFIGGGVVLSIVSTVIYAIKYITAGDDQKKISEARGGLKWSVVGFVIIIMAFAIIRLVALLIGVDPNQIFIIDNVANCSC